MEDDFGLGLCRLSEGFPSLEHAIIFLLLQNVLTIAAEAAKGLLSVISS